MTQGKVKKSTDKMDRKTFEEALKPLQVELVKLQDWVVHKG